MHNINRNDLESIHGGSFAYDVGYALRLIWISGSPGGAAAIPYEIGKYRVLTQ